jgi:hypothetical protein
MRGAKGLTIRSVQARRAAVALALVCCLAGAAPNLRGAEHPSRDARIALIRSLIYDIAVSKTSLPRGKHGLYVNSKGQLDEKRLKEELRSNGPAILPGMPVAITGLQFKSNRIVLEINGGGKKRKKWYQHIEIGVGTATQPIAPQASVLTYGSFITLTFPHSTPDLTPEQARQLLDVVLDFSRHSPTKLYSPSTPPKFKEAIKKHQVVVGMTRDDVLSSKGPPDRRVRTLHGEVEEVDWIYGLPPHVLFVVFEGDTVTKVTQY